MKAGKIWGTTELIDHNSTFEFHRIEFKSNHCCSEHYHQTKWNGFFVESGVLLVKTWTKEPTDTRPNMLCDQTVLRAGDYYKVPPGLWHQFVGVEDGVAFELYWAEFNGNDIVRRTQGKEITSGEI